MYGYGNDYSSMSSWGTPPTPYGFTNNLTPDPLASLNTGFRNPGSGSFMDKQNPMLGFSGTSIGGAPVDQGLFGKTYDFFKDHGTSLLGGAKDIASMYYGLRNYGLAKDALNMQRENYERNYASQRQLTNAQLEDRQRARVAANPNQMSVEDYMARNGIK